MQDMNFSSKKAGLTSKQLLSKNEDAYDQSSSAIKQAS